MNNHILSYYGRLHTGYLHDYGVKATNKCINLLELNTHDTILEIGFGTGATLVKIAANYRNVNCHGTDVSEVMYNVANKRIKFCNLTKQINLHLTIPGKPLPFKENTFDKVYAESVLAIQEGENLPILLNEIKRVLKPNGTLVLNETLWRKSTDEQTMNNINKLNKTLYGIIQANQEYPTVTHWKNLLNKHQLNCIIELPLKNIEPIKSTRFSKPLILSNLFTVGGKLNSFINPSLLKKRLAFRKAMIITKDSRHYLEGMILKSINNK